MGEPARVDSPVTGCELLRYVVEHNETLREDGPRSRVLVATIEALLSGDESEIGVTRLSRQAGYSTTPIYQHFGSRRELIDEAYLEIFRAAGRASHERIASFLSEVSTREELDARWSRVGKSPQQLRDDHVRRRLRFIVLAKAATRPELTLLIHAENERFQKEMIAAVDQCRARGVITSPLSSRQLAKFHVGLHLMRATDEEFSENPLTDDEWLGVKRFIFGLGPVARPTTEASASVEGASSSAQ